MAPISLNRAVVRQRLALAGRGVDRPRAGLGPSPAGLRGAPDLETRVIEFPRRADGRECHARAGFRNAVSLRVQPQLVLALRAALVRAPGIKAAFVSGSAAKDEERPRGDIDLMVIGDDVTHADCFAGLLNAESLLKRRIRATFVGAQEWQRKLKRRSEFVAKLRAEPRIFIFTTADDLHW